MTDATRTINILRSGVTVPGRDHIRGGRVAYSGETITLTPEQIEMTRDRAGKSWLDMTPEQQIAKWGEQKFADGPAPEGTEIATDDIGIMSLRREAAMEEALRIVDRAERTAAIQKIYARFGRPQTQWTLGFFEGDDA